MPSVLVVCTANICRSPMAEAVLKHLVANRPDADQWHIESAGTWADTGRLAAPLSQRVMQGMGLDISGHRSKPVSQELLDRFDLILTMEKAQKEGLVVVFPRIAGRVYLLSEMVNQEKDISDPIGGNLEDYQATANELEAILSDGLSRIAWVASHR